MDIKYDHIQGTQPNALLLTMIDVFSRKILTHMLRFNIKNGDVFILLSLLLMEYKIEGITIRNHNGSQFIATVVDSFWRRKESIRRLPMWPALKRMSISKPCTAIFKGKLWNDLNLNQSIMPRWSSIVIMSGTITIGSTEHWAEISLTIPPRKSTYFPTILNWKNNRNCLKLNLIFYPKI